MKRIIIFDEDILYSNILTFSRSGLVLSPFWLFSIKTISLFILDVVVSIT